MITPVIFYGQPFVLSFAFASILCFVIIKVSNRFNFDDNRKGARHIHKKTISRFGGVAIILAFVSALLLNKYLFFDNIVWAMIIGGVVILLLGLLDDIKPLSWKTQIFSQVVIVLFVFIMGVRTEFITNPFGGVIWLVQDNMSILSLLFMLVWMLVVMNAINWSDGIDGLSGGVVFIAAITLFLISLQPHVMQPPLAIIAIVLAGSVGGFLIFNFPTAKVFAGSSGAFFMGYIIALVAISAGAKIGTTLLVLSVPIVDAMWVVGNRFGRGVSVFHGDKKHLHHRLLDRGWSVRNILALYYSITILCAVLAIITATIGKFVTLVSFCAIILIFFIILSYGEQKKEAV